MNREIQANELGTWYRIYGAKACSSRTTTGSSVSYGLARFARDGMLLKTKMLAERAGVDSI